MKKKPQVKCPWCGRMVTPHKERLPRHVQSGHVQCVGAGQTMLTVEQLRASKDAKKP